MPATEPATAPPARRESEPAAAAAGRRAVLRFAARAVLSAAFVALAFRGISVATVADDLGRANPAWLAGGLAVLALSFALGAARWRLLALGEGIAFTWPAVLRYTWIGLFFTNVLPTGFGGDAVRAWVAGRRAGALSRVTASVLIDRLVAVWALVALGALAVAVEFARLPAVAITGAILSVAAVIAGTLILLIPAPARALSAATRRWPRVSEPVTRVADTLAHYARRRRLLARAFAISLLAQGCVVAAAYLLARGLRVHAGVALLAASIPVALLATATPTNINGLGVRETVFRVLLVPAGVLPAQAVAFSLLTVVAAAIVSLPGSLAWLLMRRRSGRALAFTAATGDGAALRSPRVAISPAGAATAPRPAPPRPLAAPRRGRASS